MAEDLRRGDDAVASYYDEQVRRFGDDVRSLDWGSRRTQRLRFAVLTAGLLEPGRSILDVGCGLGDLAGVLPPEIDYLGVDIAQGMVDTARSAQPTRRFEVGHLLEPSFAPGPFDLVVASGIFAKRGDEPERYLEAMVAAMWSRAAVAVAFNSLSAWGGSPDEDEFQADPLSTLRFCRTLTPFVELRHDYLPHDFTVRLFREQRG
jgi:SAM-dependent methyltransferase